MRIYAIISIVSLVVGAAVHLKFAPRPQPVDRIVTKTEYIERTQILTKTKWITKDGTVVEQERFEDTAVSSKSDKTEAIHVVDKFRPKMYELGVFREATSNEFKIMGAVQLGYLPLKLGAMADVSRSPSFYIGAIYAF